MIHSITDNICITHRGKYYNDGSRCVTASYFLLSADFKQTIVTFFLQNFVQCSCSIKHNYNRYNPPSALSVQYNYCCILSECDCDATYHNTQHKPTYFEKNSNLVSHSPSVVRPHCHNTWLATLRKHTLCFHQFSWRQIVMILLPQHHRQALQTVTTVHVLWCQCLASA